MEAFGRISVEPAPWPRCSQQRSGPPGKGRRRDLPRVPALLYGTRGHPECECRQPPGALEPPLQHREAQHLGVAVSRDLGDDRGQLVGRRDGHMDGEVEIMAGPGPGGVRAGWGHVEGSTATGTPNSPAATSASPLLRLSLPAPTPSLIRGPCFLRYPMLRKNRLDRSACNRLISQQQKLSRLRTSGPGGRPGSERRRARREWRRAPGGAGGREGRSAVVRRNPKRFAGLRELLTRKNPNRERLGLGCWWRRRESNPRPQALCPWYYMLSPLYCF